MLPARIYRRILTRALCALVLASLDFNYRRVQSLQREIERVAMTARGTTLKGLNAGMYYTEQLPSYYLDAGEPGGV